MKTATVQDLGMVNDVNLCDTCCYEQPTCTGDNLIFGSGIGNDNIVACSAYDAIECRQHNCDGDG